MDLPRTITTRKELKPSLIALCIRNEELEELLEESKRNAQRYQIKNSVQTMLIAELIDAIHSLGRPVGCDNSNDWPSIDMCRLLTQNAQHIANLSIELETLKLQHQGQEGKENEQDEATIIKDSPTSPLESKEIVEDYERMKSKCDSLERSLDTLKQKNKECRLRSSVSLKTMSDQISDLQRERKRRLDMQLFAEDRVEQLEKEIQEMKNIRNNHPISFGQSHEIENGTNASLCPKCICQNDEKRVPLRVDSSNSCYIAGTMNANENSIPYRYDDSHRFSESFGTNHDSVTGNKNRVFMVPSLVALSEDSEEDE